MFSGPFFSVIIPAYNREKYILRAIDSIKTQHFTNWEIIVVNDASTDQTVDVLSGLNDSRIKVIHNQVNQERCISRNTGIHAARGEYICFLDSDDYHLPNHLSELYQFIESKNFPEALFFTNAFNETEDGRRFERLCPEFTPTNPYSYFLRFTVNPQRWAVHRKIFQNIQFDPEVTICEDMDTSMRIAAAGYPIYQVNLRTTVYVAALDSFTHGDRKKWNKELFFLKRIFRKKVLKGKLPVIEKWRLLSMCHFHLALNASERQQIAEFYKHAAASFFLCPVGYNRKTNKVLLVNAIYNLPLIGDLIRKARRLIK